MAEEPKLCRHCKHCRTDVLGAVCFEPREVFTDLVTGDQRGGDCYTIRDDADKCGPSGAWFVDSGLRVTVSRGVKTTKPWWLDPKGGWAS